MTDSPDPDDGIERRRYLQLAGAAGLLAAGSGTAGAVRPTDRTAAAASALSAMDDDWEAAADKRIADHRMADLAVEVVDDEGEALEGAQVEVSMVEHAYDFGTMIHAEFLTNGTEWGEEMYTSEDQAKYRETVEDLFNTVVLENLHKWNQWEDNTAIADEAVDWAVERGMDVRGHVCLWGNVDAWAIPADVVEAMGVEWEAGGATDPDHDPEYVVQRSMDHIETIITHYGDDIAEWEITNEVIHQPAMIEAVEGEDVDPVEAEILGDWFEHAQTVADEEGVDIAVNDYNTLAGGYEDTRDTYERQIEYLVEERGIDLDGVGFQCHFADDERLTPEEIMAGLDRYEGYGAGFRATEFDVFQGDWEDPEEQGDYLRTFLKAFFSHPGTDSFLVWGHWDGVHWAPDYDGSDPDGVLFDQEWNPKPAHDHYTDLVFGEWWTDEEGETADGSYETRAFKGDYEITVCHDGHERTVETTVTDDGTVTVSPYEE